MKYWILMLVSVLFLGGCSFPGSELTISDIKDVTVFWTPEPINIPEEEEPESQVLYTGNRTEQKKTETEEGQKIPVETVVFKGEFLEKGSTFAYNQLTEPEKIWYHDIEDILGDMTEGELSPEGLKQGLDAEHIDHIFQGVMQDHPELFFVDGYTCSVTSLNGVSRSIKLSGTYNTDLETARWKKSQISAAAGNILCQITEDMDDYEKIKLIYEYIIRNTDYSLEAPDNQNLYSVLVGGKSVCQGYAGATQYLLNRAGVDCTLIQGIVSSGQRHSWNLVKADGDYYYLDTTWGDASYQPMENGQAAVMQDINYDYLCVTSEELLKTHSLDTEYAVPVCTAVKDNYFVRENAWFTEMDENRLRELFDRAQQEQTGFVCFKCADESCYQDFLQKLITEAGIFDYLPGNNGSVAYIQNERQFSLSFWMTN